MLLIFFGRAIQFLLALVIMRAVTTILPPSEVGRMSLFMSATAFFALFLVNPVGVFINRRLHSWESQGVVKRYLDYYWSYLLFVSVLSSISLIVLNNMRFIGLQTNTAWLWLLVGGSLLFNTINQTVIPSLNLLGFRGWFIGLSLGTLVTGFLVAVSLVLNYQPRAEYWLLGLLIGQAVFAGVGIKVLFFKMANHQSVKSGEETRENIGALYAFAWPVSIAVGLNWVQTQSYRFGMDGTMGLHELGLFVAGYGISAGLIAGFESVLTTYFQPIFYKRVSTENSEDQIQAWASYASAIFPALLLLMVFIVIMAPELTRAFLGESYQSSAKYVLWGALSEAMRVIAGVYSMAAHARMKTRLLLIPNLTGALASLGLLALLKPWLGMTGVGAALAGSGLAMLIVLHFTIQSELKLQFPLIRLLQAAVMGGGLMVVVELIRYVHGFHEYTLISFFLLGVIGILFMLMQYYLLQNSSPVKKLGRS